MKFSGYFKNIFSYSEPYDFPLGLFLGISPQTLCGPEDVHEPEHWDDLSRLRLKFEARYKKKWAGEIQAEVRGFTQRPNKIGNFVNASPAAQRWLDLQATLYDKPGYKVTAFVDRLWVRWATDWGEVVMGRQAITWTIARLWSPNDRFGPFLPYEIEQDEKPGVDAANVAINLGEMAEFRVIFAPLDRPHDDRAGARIKADIKGFELMATGGYFSGEYSGGFGVTHSLFGALARTEFAYTHPLDNGPDRWSAIAGIDRSFLKKFYGVIEYYHQSGGKTFPDQYYESAPLYLSGKLLGLGRDYLGGLLRWQFRPEWSFTTLGVLNLNDASAVLSPRIEYDYRQNLKIVLAASLFIPNGPISEFGLLPNVYYLSFKGYF